MLEVPHNRWGERTREPLQRFLSSPLPSKFQRASYNGCMIDARKGPVTNKGRNPETLWLIILPLLGERAGARRAVVTRRRVRASKKLTLTGQGRRSAVVPLGRTKTAQHFSAGFPARGVSRLNAVGAAQFLRTSADASGQAGKLRPWHAGTNFSQAMSIYVSLCQAMSTTLPPSLFSERGGPRAWWPSART
jgi:hypothetical protein